jgi:hypothetical protein
MSNNISYTNIQTASRHNKEFPMATMAIDMFSSSMTFFQFPRDEFLFHLSDQVTHEQ